MERVVCFLAQPLDPLAFEDLGTGLSALEASARFASVIKPSRILVLGPSWARETLMGSFGPIVPEWHELSSGDWADVLEILAGQVGPGFSLVFVRADAPFQNLELFRRLSDLHETYKAHFTFADAYPGGLGVDLLASGLLAPLRDLAIRVKAKIGRDGLFQVIRHDVNAFDVETEIAAVDLRMLRLSFHADSPLHQIILKRFASLMPEPWHSLSPESIADLIRTNGAALRSIPNWFNLALLDACPQSCTFCPWGVGGRTGGTRKMDLAQLKHLVSRIAAFNPRASVSVSLWGEPALYEAFFEFARHLLDTGSLELFVETSGIGWNLDRVKELASHPGAGRISWIVGLESLDRAMYETLRGKGYDEAWGFARAIRDLYPGKTWVQAVRSTQTDHVLQDFYQKTKAEGLEPIIQKYDHHSLRLPDLRVSDIAPWKRFPCWHLKRDMTILVDGTVVPCREDLDGERSMGNAFSEDLETIWERGMDLHRLDLEGTHPGPCGKCDEYYTFNA